MTTIADEILGVAPPHTLDAVQAGLTRLRRNYAAPDDEEAQSRGFQRNQLDRVRRELLDSLLDWIRPGVEAEAAAWDRELQQAKDARWSR